MHANERAEIKKSAPATSPPCRAEGRDHRRTICDVKKAITLEKMDSRTP